MKGKLFLISAPSGAGKTTLVQALIDRYGFQYNLERVVTYTSKAARPAEVHGIHYNFVSVKDFEAKVQEGFFMEWSGAYQAYYGSPAHIVDMIKTGRSYLLIVDRIGAEKILERYQEVVSIWLYTKSIKDLKSRLLLRNTEPAVVIEQRLRRAQEEIDLELKHPIYTYHVLNQDFEEALDRLATIIKRELFLNKF